LKNVAINIKALYPSSVIVICGDNDLSGVGQQKAIEAALAINGKYIIPATPGQDWNDSLTMEVDHA
jgi:putative DNA primase/helicase